MTPRYTHDCTKCKFVLGTLSADSTYTDWYVCEGGDPSVIGRYGDEGHEYVSWPRPMVERPEFLHPVPILTRTPAVSELRILAAHAFARYKEQQA